jgi:HEAT repeat protein
MKLISMVAILAALVAASATGDDGKPTQTAPAEVRQRVDRLMEQLDANEFQKRQTAQDALVEVGRPAMGRLRKLLAGSPPLEVRRRAAAALREIERAVLQPKTFSVPEVSPQALAVSRDGRYAAAPLETRYASTVLDLASGKTTRLTSHHYGSVFHPDGSRVLS